MADQFLSLIRKTCTFDKRRFASDVQRFQTLTLPPPKPAPLRPLRPATNGHTNKRQKTQHTTQHNQPHDDDGGGQRIDSSQQADSDDSGDDVEAKIEVDSDEEHEDEANGEEDEAPPSSSPAADDQQGAISLFAHSQPLPSTAPSSSPGPRPPTRLRLLKQLRKHHQIHIHGHDVPNPITDFTQLTAAGLPGHVLGNVVGVPPVGLGFDEPTGVQMQAIPVMLAGRECVGCSPTGSGKTAAYLLPLLIDMYRQEAAAKDASKLKIKDEGTATAEKAGGGVHAIVIAPTKELATQIHRVAMRLTHPRKHRILLLSKANANPLTFRQPVDLLVCTPWRLHALLAGGAGQEVVGGLRHVVLDEADRLLDMGFMEQVDDVLARLRGKGEKVRCYALHLFSATIPQALDALLPSLLHSPIKVVIAQRNIAQSTVQQSLQFVGDERGKLLALSNMRAAGLTVPMLIFVQSSSRAQQLLQYLQHDGLTSVAAMHGELSSKQRLDVLSAFRSGSTSILITTDLLSRGMDLLNVHSVLNFDFPQSTTAYIHRIGRTGRAGRAGTAVTLFTESDRPLLRHVASVMKASGQDVASWMMGLGRVGRGRGARLERDAPARESIVRPSEEDKRRHAKKRMRKERERKHAAEELHGGGTAVSRAVEQRKHDGADKRPISKATGVSKASTVKKAKRNRDPKRKVAAA